MKIQYCEGCTTYGIWVNDYEMFIDKDVEEQRKILTKIYNNVEIEDNVINDLIMDMCDSNGEYVDKSCGVDTNYDSDYVFMCNGHTYMHSERDWEDDFYVDDKPISEISDIREQLRDAIPYINEDVIYEWVEVLLKSKGQYEDLGRCEQCGDSVCCYTFEILN